MALVPVRLMATAPLRVVAAGAATLAAAAGSFSRSFSALTAPARAAAAVARGAILHRRRLQATLRALGDLQILVQVRRRAVGFAGLGRAEIERVVDERPLVHVVPVDEGHRDAGAAGAARAADAVQVRLLIVGHGVVDDVRHVVDIDAAGGHVGRDQDVFLAGFEGGHRALALILVQVAVHAGGREAAIDELLLQLGGGPLRAHEDHGLAAALGLQDAADHLVLVERVRAVDDVLDVRLHRAFVGVGGADVDRVAHEAARECDDRARHGGREQHRVAAVGRLREELLDVGEEAEVEHLVGLVEHHLAHVLEIEQALAREVEQAARRADDDLRARLQLLDLTLVGLAAVDRHDVRRAALRGQLEILEHLHREFAGRHDHERLHARLGGGAEALQQRQAEAEGLAGAGLRLADDVLALEREGDGLLLDREGVDDALAREGVDHVLLDAEFGERCHYVLFLSVSCDATR